MLRSRPLSSPGPGKTQEANKIDWVFKTVTQAIVILDKSVPIHTLTSQSVLYYNLNNIEQSLRDCNYLVPVNDVWRCNVQYFN